jgi:hypothetical protein
MSLDSTMFCGISCCGRWRLMVCWGSRARPVVEQIGNRVQRALVMNRLFGTLGKHVPEQPVGVLAGPSLPGPLRVAEVHTSVGAASKIAMPGHLLALIVGQGLPHRLRDQVELEGEGSSRRCRSRIRHSGEQYQARGALHQHADGGFVARTLDEIAVPVARHGEISHLWGPVMDADQRLRRSVGVKLAKGHGTGAAGLVGGLSSAQSVRTRRQIERQLAADGAGAAAQGRSDGPQAHALQKPLGQYIFSLGRSAQPSFRSIARMLNALLAAALLALGAASAHADMPLAIGDLITDKGKIKLDLSLAYANTDRQGISTGEPITVQTGPASFVTLPTLISESKGNSDLLVGTLGLRYGLTAKAEIFARTSYLTSISRSSDMSGTSRNSESRFADAWAGINYQFKKDNDTPALLGFAEFALREKHEKSSSSLKSALMGITTYKAIDPVVFSFTTAYRFNHSRQDGDISYKPGNLFLLNPSIAFAVNDRVTLTTSMQWTNRQAEKRGAEAQGFRRTSSDLLLGMGYGISKENTLNLTFKSNVSGSSGADLRLSWLRSF